MPERGRPGTGDGGLGAVTVGAGTCADEFLRDEQLLRAARPAVRVTVLTDRAVSYGIGVRTESPFLERARGWGLALARRTSGGTGVLHEPGDLAWSVVLPRSHPAVGRDYARAYDRLGAGVVRFLRSHRIDGAWTTPPNLCADCCVLSGRGLVLSVAGRILGGAAQHVTALAILHQGMVARSVDRALVARLFAIPDPSPVARMIGLDELGVAEPSARLAHELANETLPILGAGPG